METSATHIDGLCSTCSAANLTEEDFGPNSKWNWKDKPIQLGAIQGILERVTCPLCRLVVSVLETEPRLKTKYPDWRNSECELKWSSVNRIEYSVGDGIRRPSLGVLLPQIPVRFHQEIEQISAPCEQEPLMGRLYDAEKVDPNCLKRWISCCQEWHGDSCQNPFVFVGQESVCHSSWFLVVDVNTQQLTSLPVDESYVALSYVWGDTNDCCTKRENLDELKRIGGLAQTFPNLPNTIKDAMILVRDLGLRYLWVDYLCIVQDDDEIKRDAIANMHRVYLEAFVVIVAGSGTDAQAGLPGVNGRHRGVHQVAELVSSSLRLGLIPHYGSASYLSVHSTRAWT
jgi:hypothetical protein